MPDKEALRIKLPGSPFGIGWGFLYGYQNVPALTYMPQLRRIGARFTKVYLFWNQVEPEKGIYDWQPVDAFINQLDQPEQGLIALFSSSLWAARRPAALLPPSPAIHPDDYERFIYELVHHCRGRVRYWQNDAEPNNPIYWSGSKEEYVKQLKIFYRAVKKAEPDAVVVVGGYDGLFNPPGMRPFPNQQAGLEFFDYVIQEGAAAFDLFDLHLYNDPYTIPACVDIMRQKMRAVGCEKPIICTEYGGPAFFSFPENRKYIPLIASWAQSGLQTDDEGMPTDDVAGKQQIDQMYRERYALAPQTQMFMQDCDPQLQVRYERIQARELVTRTLLALSAGVQKLLYWQFLFGTGPKNDLMDLMYGKIGMQAYEEGQPAQLRPIASVYEQMSRFLTGVRQVTRIDDPTQPTIFLYRVEREKRGPLLVVWERRDPFSGEELPPVPFHYSWEAGTVRAVDALGNEFQARIIAGGIFLHVSDLPVYLEGIEVEHPAGSKWSL